MAEEKLSCWFCDSQDCATCFLGLEKRGVCRLGPEAGASSWRIRSCSLLPTMGRVCAHVSRCSKSWGLLGLLSLFGGAVTSAGPQQPQRTIETGRIPILSQRGPWGWVSALQTGPWDGGEAQSGCLASGRIFGLHEAEESTFSSFPVSQSCSSCLTGRGIILQSASPYPAPAHKTSMVESKRWAPF